MLKSNFVKSFLPVYVHAGKDLKQVKNISDLCTTQVKFCRSITGQQILEFCWSTNGSKTPGTLESLSGLATDSVRIKSNHLGAHLLRSLGWLDTFASIRVSYVHCCVSLWALAIFCTLLGNIATLHFGIAHVSIKCLPTTCHSQLGNTCRTMPFCISN